MYLYMCIFTVQCMHNYKSERFIITIHIHLMIIIDFQFTSYLYFIIETNKKYVFMIFFQIIFKKLSVCLKI